MQEFGMKYVQNLVGIAPNNYLFYLIHIGWPDITFKDIFNNKSHLAPFNSFNGLDSFK